jgi:hypothetical protein
MKTVDDYIYNGEKYSGLIGDGEYSNADWSLTSVKNYFNKITNKTLISAATIACKAYCLGKHCCNKSKRESCYGGCSSSATARIAAINAAAKAITDAAAAKIAAAAAAAKIAADKAAALVQQAAQAAATAAQQAAAIAATQAAKEREAALWVTRISASTSLSVLNSNRSQGLSACGRYVIGARKLACSTQMNAAYNTRKRQLDTAQQAATALQNAAAAAAASVKVKAFIIKMGTAANLSILNTYKARAEAVCNTLATSKIKDACSRPISLAYSAKKAKILAVTAAGIKASEAETAAAEAEIRKIAEEAQKNADSEINNLGDIPADLLLSSDNDNPLFKAEEADLLNDEEDKSFFEKNKTILMVAGAAVVVGGALMLRKK